MQAASNGIEFAKSKEFCRAAAEAGLRYVYLQFDGIGNAANSHRKVGNLFDVKLQAINNLHEAGVEIVPVTTIINGINNEQVGRIIQFALDNPKTISFLSFQPVSFTGRDEDITDERRFAQRYTLSHMAHDIKNQMGFGEPERDWFPISFMSTFSDWADLIHGPAAEWGQLCCGCHPNCGIGMAMMIDKETKEAAPVTAFLNMDKVAKDLAKVNDAARGKWLSVIGFALALLRNYDPFQSPTHFKITDMLKKMDKTFNATGKNYGSVKGDRTLEDIKKRRQDRWNFLFIAGMWFQDLFNYDFRRTEQCIIPYATQEGEISFCAYNTGIGWRNIIEKMHMTATLTKWYEEHGRHEIFAGGKKVGMIASRPRAAAQHGSRQLRGQPHARRVGHRQERPRREDPRPRSQADGCRRERTHGQALSRTHPRGKAGRRTSYIGLHCSRQVALKRKRIWSPATNFLGSYSRKAQRPFLLGTAFVLCPIETWLRVRPGIRRKRNSTAKGSRQGWRKDMGQNWNIDVQKSNHRDGDDHCFNHQPGLAIELLRILCGAVGLKCQPEVRGHQEGYEGKNEDQLKAIPHDKRPEKEHCG